MANDYSIVMQTAANNRKLETAHGHGAQPGGHHLSTTARLGLMLLVTAPMAISYSAIKAGLAYAPPLRFAGLRTLFAELVLMLVLPRSRDRAKTLK